MRRRSTLYLFIALCAAGIFLGAAAALWADFEVTKRRVTSQVNSAASAYAVHAQRNLEELRLGLDWLAQKIEPGSRDLGFDPESAEMARLMTRRLPGLSALLFIDADGRIRYSTVPNAALGTSVVDRDYFQAHRHGAQEYVGAVIIAKNTGNQVYTLSRRLERDGGFAGVLVASADATKWNAIIAPLLPHLGAHLRLITRDGAVVQDQVMGADGTLSTVTGVGSDAAQFLSTSDFTARVASPANPLIAEVAVPRDSALRPWRERRIWFVAGGALGFLSLLVFGFLGQRSFRAEMVASETAAQRTRELELLMSEMEHRVKNSLFMVESLLVLQASRSDNPEVRGTLRAARARIHAIARIHSRLRGDANPSEILLDRYLGELCGDIQQPGHLRCGVSSQPIVIGTEKAIPIGLIVTELLINAGKHGGHDGMADVDISADTDGSMLTVTVRDRGQGVPAGFAPTRATGLGMTIITNLVKQLHGTFRAEDASPGARFVLTVPLAGGPASPHPPPEVIEPEESRAMASATPA